MIADRQVDAEVEGQGERERETVERKDRITEMGKRLRRKKGAERERRGD